MTTTTLPTNRRLDAARAAYRVLGQVIETMPSGFEGHVWAIETTLSSGPRIQIQQGSRRRPDEVTRTGIRSIADLLGFTYEELRHNTYVHVRAVGEIDGIRVEVWDHVERAYDTGGGA